MNRYLRWYKAVFKISLNKFLVYRLDAIINTFFSSLIWTLFNVFSMYLVTLRIDSAFGWTTGELILISCIYNVIIGVFSLLFGRGFNEFSELVDKGKFDLLLLRPFDSQVYTSLHRASISSGFRTVLGTILAVVVALTYNIAITPFGILAFIGGSVLAIILLYSLLFFMNTFVIWAPRLDNVSELFYTLRSLGRYPRETFRQLHEIFFVIVSPFIMIMSTPTRLLLGKASPYDVVELLIATAAAFVVARLFWKFALRHYTSASS